MSSNLKFKRPILKFSSTGYPVEYAWWFHILNWIVRNPNRTSKECRRAIKPYNCLWDRFATNSWSDAVHYGLITKTRVGNTFKYSITEKGQELVDRVHDRKRQLLSQADRKRTKA